MLKICTGIALSLFACSCGKTTSSESPKITLLGRNYHLGSYNQTAKPTWEFVTEGENVQNWTTLVTILDRPDAATPKDLDRLAEGIMANYTANHGQILLAKSFPSPAGAYDYMAVAFEQPAQNRFELNFVKVAMGPKNAYVVVYGVRVSDPQNYLRKGKDYLNQHSSEIGDALEKFTLPDLATFPRQPF